MEIVLSRADVMRFRVRAQELDAVGPRDDARVLDLGVQDTGPDGYRWALTSRGCTRDPADVFHAWTLRGAPHAYRRAEVAEVAAAVRPWSDTDAAKRIFDAARPLRNAGISIQDAIDEVAAAMRDIVREPMVKGDVSTALTERLPEPYLRWCNPCQAVHTYEQPFRLAALRAGLELVPGTSPPVLRPIPGWRGEASSVPRHLHLVRRILGLVGPSTPKQVAEFIDSPVREVNAHWPDDTVEVSVNGEVRQVLSEDLPALRDTPQPREVRLLGPFDLFLQARDRQMLVPDSAARKDLWRALGRPGGVLVRDQLVGSWRPRASGEKLRLVVTMWGGSPRPPALDEHAERLAAFRGLTFAGYVDG